MILEISRKLIRLIYMTLKYSDGIVIIGGCTSLRLSAILFNLALYSIIKTLLINSSRNILYSRNHLSAYADDVCLTSRNILSLKDTFSALNKKNKVIVLFYMNENKTKYMHVGSGRCSSTLDIDGYSYEQVKSFFILN